MVLVDSLVDFAVGYLKGFQVYLVLEESLVVLGLVESWVVVVLEIVEGCTEDLVNFYRLGK